MKIHYKLILLLCFTISALNAMAQKQDGAEKLPKYTISTEIFTLASGGLRLDFEKQLSSPKDWLQIHVNGYYLPYRNNKWDSWETLQSDSEPIDKLNGAGFGIAYKSFFYKDIIYYRAGVSYNHYRVKYSGYDYISFVEDGLTYYTYEEREWKQVFNKILPSLSLGIQSSLSNKIFFDAYAGVAYSASFYDKDKYAFDDNIFGYGYRGVTMTGGIRVGFAFGK